MRASLGPSLFWQSVPHHTTCLPFKHHTCTQARAHLGDWSSTRTHTHAHASTRACTCSTYQSATLGTLTAGHSVYRACLLAVELVSLWLTAPCCCAKHWSQAAWPVAPSSSASPLYSKTGAQRPGVQQYKTSGRGDCHCGLITPTARQETAQFRRQTLTDRCKHVHSDLEACDRLHAC